jgi:hypothetical protein
LLDDDGKESRFWPAGHAKAYSKDKNDDNFSSSSNPQGTAYFSCLFVQSL